MKFEPRSNRDFLADWGWRPLAMVTLSMLLFGFLVTRLGLVPALAAMFIVGAAAGRRWPNGRSPSGRGNTAP